MTKSISFNQSSKAISSNKLKLTSILGLIALSGCGGGGADSSDSQDVINNITAKAHVVLSPPEVIINDQSAVSKFQLSVEAKDPLYMAAASAENEIKILARSFSPALNNILVDEDKSFISCQEGDVLRIGESCQDTLTFRTLDQAATYQGKIIYHTSEGDAAVDLSLKFKPQNDPAFDKNKFQITKITPLATGMRSKINFNNATSKAINNPKIHFPAVILPFVEKLQMPSTIAAGQSAVVDFEIINTPDALSALKVWQNDLALNKESAYIRFSSANFPENVYPLKPVFYLTALASSKENITQFEQENGKWIHYLNVVNTTSDTLTTIEALLSAELQEVSIDTSLCAFPLKPNAGCNLKIVVDPNISAKGKHKLSGQLSLSVMPASSVRYDLSINLDINAQTTLELTSDSTLIANYENTIKLKNTGGFAWQLPFVDEANYRILDKDGNDVGKSLFSLDFDKNNMVILAGELKTFKLMTHRIIDESLAPFYLQIDNVENPITVMLPDYTTNGLSENLLLNPKTMIAAEKTSLYFTIAPPNGEVFDTFMLREGLTGVVQDQTITDSCISGQAINADKPCMLKVDIPKNELLKGHYDVTLFIQYKDQNTATLPLSFDVVDPKDVSADLSGLAKLTQLHEDSTYIRLLKDRVQIKVKNTTDQVIANVDFTNIASWLVDLVDESALQKTPNLAIGQEMILELHLKNGVSTSDFHHAILMHLNEIKLNNDTKSSVDKVVVIQSSNSMDDFYPRVAIDNMPLFADGVDASTMTFTKPGDQYLIINNPSSINYQLAIDSSLPQGMRVVEGSSYNGIANCLPDKFLLAKSQCVLIVNAQSDANEYAHDYLNISLTPLSAPEIPAINLSVNFQTNYVYRIGYEVAENPLQIPVSGSQVYDLKLVNNELDMQWISSTDIQNYVLQGVNLKGLTMVAPTKAPSCLDSTPVAIAEHCYIGLEINENAQAAAYQLSLKMGETNLAQETTEVGELTVIDHGVAEVLLEQDNQSVTKIMQGESFDVIVKASDSAWVGITKDQSFTISANNPMIRFNGETATQCTLKVNDHKASCKIPVQVDAGVNPGNYQIKLSPNADTAMALNQPSIDFTVAGNTWEKLAVGSAHTCGISSQGKVYCWGSNTYLQLGVDTGNNQSSLVPVAVDRSDALADKTVIEISAGNHHTCAITDDQQIACWGENLFGQLGNGEQGGKHFPVLVDMTETMAGKKAYALALGENFSCALASSSGDSWGHDAEGYCWGANSKYELGTILNNGAYYQASPVKVDLSNIVGDKRVESISAGRYHACLMVSENSGTMYCWGSNSNGQIGNGKTGGFAKKPEAVTNLPRAINWFTTGDNHTCAHDHAADTYCWGEGKSGQLGYGGIFDKAKPTLVTGAIDNEILHSIKAGSQYTCASTWKQEVYCWGKNSKGQLGNGQNGNQALTPVAVNTNILAQGEYLTLKLALGSMALHSCAISNKGNVYCWGWGSAGQLGNGTQNDSALPVKVSI